MSESPIDPELSSGAQLEAARRAKLNKLVELGVDPWGGRFDDHEAIAAIRARESEITVGAPPEGKPRVSNMAREYVRLAAWS
jgi:lysyl-tRNA synthetase class 2